MKKGFTLIELLSVIVVIAIVSVIAVPTLMSVISKARLNALKDSAYGLIESSNLYYAQYQNSNNIRFDIDNNKVVSSDTTNLLKYKGNIKEGVSIIKGNGKTVVCVTDGKNSAYKNYNESKVSLVSGKKCTIPDNSSVVYLDGEASMEDTNVSELLERINQLETRLNEYATKSELSQVNTNLSSNISANTTSINQLNNTLADLNSKKAGFPDFSNINTISSNYTCIEDGWISVYRSNVYTPTSSSLNINNINVFSIYIDRYTNDVHRGYRLLLFPVKKGDVVTFSNLEVSFVHFK